MNTQLISSALASSLVVAATMLPPLAFAQQNHDKQPSFWHTPDYAVKAHDPRCQKHNQTSRSFSVHKISCPEHKNKPSNNTRGAQHKNNPSSSLPDLVINGKHYKTYPVEPRTPDPEFFYSPYKSRETLKQEFSPPRSHKPSR